MDQPDLEANTCNTLHTWGKHVNGFGVRNKLISNAGKKLVLMQESLRTTSSMERDANGFSSEKYSICFSARKYENCFKFH